MELSKEQQDKIILGAQAVIGIAIIALSVIDSSRIQSKAMKKVLKQEAKHTGKLKKQEYRQQKKLLNQKYKKKLAKSKKGLRTGKAYGRIVR